MCNQDSLTKEYTASAAALELHVGLALALSMDGLLPWVQIFNRKPSTGTDIMICKGNFYIPPKGTNPARDKYCVKLRSMLWRL